MNADKDVDPVEELHKIRRAIWKEAGGTPDAYAQYYYEISQKRIVAGKTEKSPKTLRKTPKAKTPTRKKKAPALPARAGSD